MRGMRWLLLVAIAAILGGVVYQYRAQKKLLAGSVPAAPDPLSADLSASSQHWQYRDKDLKTGRIKSDIDAESMQQVKDASRVDLKNVTMKVYGKDGKTYDLVKSAAATFNTDRKEPVFRRRLSRSRSICRSKASRPNNRPSSRPPA